MELGAGQLKRLFSFRVTPVLEAVLLGTHGLPEKFPSFLAVVGDELHVVASRPRSADQLDFVEPEFPVDEDDGLLVAAVILGDRDEGTPTGIVEVSNFFPSEVTLSRPRRKLDDGIVQLLSALLKCGMVSDVDTVSPVGGDLEHVLQVHLPVATRDGQAVLGGRGLHIC